MADWAGQAALADVLGVGLLMVDSADRISAANRSAHELLRARPDSLPGRSTIEAFVDHRTEELIRSAREQRSASGEYAQPGEPPTTLLVRAWRKQDGDEVSVALEDVSELRRLRRIRREFIDNLSHELRTPLTTMRLLAESLALEAKRSELPERVRDAIGRIDLETGHLVRMVDELLDLATIEQGEAPLKLAPVDLAQVVSETLDRVRGYAEHHGVTLSEDLPSAEAERTVPGDAVRLGQVLVNLVDNAIRYSPDGGEVVVHVRPTDDEVVVEVEDHGPGIAKADLERIFERFYKTDRARARGRAGTGLGLSIARHIAERHGGRMWAKSQPGRGAQLFLALPRGSRDGERHAAG